MNSKTKILYNLLILIGVLVIVELYAKIFPQWTPQWTQERQWIAAFALERNKTHKIYPGLGVVLIPNIHRELTAHPDHIFSYDTIPLGNEPIGLRDEPSNKEPWAVVLGDSFIEGFGVKFEDLFVKRLEQKIGKRFLNLGQSGFTTNQYEALLKIALQYYKPSLILVCIYGENDFDDRIIVKSLSEANFQDANRLWNIQSSISFISVWLLKNSFAYRLLRAPDIILRESRNIGTMESRTGIKIVDYTHKNKTLNLVIRAHKLLKTDELSPYDTETDIWKEAVSLVKIDLQRMKEQARKSSAKLGIIYVSGKKQTYLHILENHYKISKNFDLSNQTIKSICSELSIPFLDLTPEFRKEAKKGRQLYFRIDGHWNAEGNHLASEIVYEWLKKNKWITTPQ